MSTRVLMLSWTLVALAATTAVAAAAPRAPRPQPVQRPGPPSVPAPAQPAPPVLAPTHPVSCTESYSNIGVPNGFYFPAGAGVQVLDELHLGPVVVNAICAFDLGYYKEGPGTTDATVTFYYNNPADDPPGPVLATFSVPGLPSGENGFHIEVATSSLTQDVWMGVSFNTPNTGLLLADPHWPGASDDWFVMRPPNQYYNFGGNPKSNFLLGAYATYSPTAVEPGEPPLTSGFRRDPSPNPSSGGIDLDFAIRESGHVRAEVLDVAGRAIAVIANRVFETGVHALSWDGRATGGHRVSAGVFLVRLSMPGFAGSRKVVLMR